jgi:hypothetical protein
MLPTLVHPGWSPPVHRRLKRRDKYAQASYEDFLEALARLVTFVKLPDAELLKRYGCTSAHQFFEQIEKNVHDGAVMMHQRKAWHLEEKSHEPLAEQLEMVIGLILDRCDEEMRATSSAEGKSDRRLLAQNKRLQGRAEVSRLQSREALLAPLREEASPGKMRPRRQSLQIEGLEQRLAQKNAAEHAAEGATGRRPSVAGRRPSVLPGS